MIDKLPHCRSCPIAGNMRGFIHATGTGAVPLMIVGEGGGRTEAREGKPFVGAAGNVLERAIRMAGLNRNDYTVTNLLHCQPPGNELRGAAYEREAIDHCRPFLNDEVDERRPRIILALGEVPLRELCSIPVTQSEHRGYVLPSIYPDTSVIGSFHPSRILRGDWKLFGILMHDLRRASSLAKNSIPSPLPTRYNLDPTVDDCHQFLQRLKSDPSLLLSIDLETASIIGQPESELWKEKTIIQIQFSTAAGEALVVPFTDEFFDPIRSILLTDNPKVGWNSRLSDEIVLKAHGFSIGGEFYDGMTMFSHLQPNFAGGKDANDDEDKGVPARLLNLQSAISFYYPWETPYKSLMRQGLKKGNELTPDELWHEVRIGGARDVDLTWRIGTRLMQTLRSQGLWHGYYRYKHQFGKVLSKLSERGLPIDKGEQELLRQDIEALETSLEHELQSMIPDQLKPFKPYKGFPADLRELVKAEGRWVKRCKPIEFPDLATGLGYVIVGDNGDGQLRKPLPFNSSSPKQVLAYLNYMVDTIGEPWFIPIDVDSKKPTTNKAGIQSLIEATNDAALIQIEKSKKVSKLLDYCQGEWIPGDDGRVHADFRVGATATGQTSAVRPAIQTFPKHVDPEELWLVPIVKRIKSIIRAEPGHKMVEVDMTGFHAKVQGHLAGDALYSRLASFDLHSYNTAYYLKLPDAPELSSLDDAALEKRLKEIRTAHSFERNFILKRIAYLRQFRGGEQKAASILKIPVIEVMEIFDMMDALFKPTFIDFPASVEKMIKTQPKLVSPFGCQRWFWDGDIQQAVAFLPANCAHCTIADAMIRLDDKGALDKYGCVNFVHDSAWFHCPEELVDECIAMVKEEFEKPSEILISEEMGAFQCGAGASVGNDMASLKDF